MPHEFVPLAERICEALLASDPQIAHTAGDHRFDDQLPDWSADAVAERVAMLRDADAALSAVDGDALPPEDQVDHAILHARVERLLFELSEIREHEWNPLVHNPGALLNSLLARPFAPAETRLEALAGRLAALPDALATAREVLGDCPRIHLETAVGQFLGTASLIRSETPVLLSDAPSLASTVEPLAAAAVDALTGFASWLRERVPDGERDPRLGRRLWEARLWHALDTDLTAKEVLDRAWANLDRVGAEIEAAASRLSPGDPVQAVLDRLADEHPSDDSIVDAARVALADTTAFVGQFELVTLIDDPCEIRTMPEFARGVAVAYCDPPGALEGAGVPTFYCIAPTPADWTPERVESFYREYNDHMVRNLTVHEAMPGHFLQLAHARRFRGSSRVRSLGRSGPFVEGWAVYAEEVMVDHGYGGAPVRLQQLKMQLRMTINAIIDQLVHCEGMAEADAMELMTGRGFQEEGEAAGKWRRALLTSTQLSTYFVGYSEVSGIGRARPAGTGLRAWHDSMLAHGSPPPRHLKSLLGV